MIRLWRASALSILFTIGLLFGAVAECDTKPGDHPWETRADATEVFYIPTALGMMALDYLAVGISALDYVPEPESAQ